MRCKHTLLLPLNELTVILIMQKGYKMLKCTNAEEREINQNHCKKCDQNLEERNSDIYSPSLCSNTAEVKKIVLFKNKCYCLIFAQYNVSIK